MMACKSFKKSGTNLCSAIATRTRRLCTEYVDPRSNEAILANRLIPLDKGAGKVQPMGVGEAIRRIMGTCVMSVTKQDVGFAQDTKVAARRQSMQCTAYLMLTTLMQCC